MRDYETENILLQSMQTALTTISTNVTFSFDLHFTPSPSICFSHNIGSSNSNSCIIVEV
jgi:hypothetical protein